MGAADQSGFDEVVNGHGGLWADLKIERWHGGVGNEPKHCCV